MLPTLVLSAGLGTRLDPLTRLVAKPAVPLAGRTLIERVLTWLHGEGVRDVVLNLHFRPETIAAVVGDGTHLGLSARYSWEQPILGSAGGPRHALPLISASTFLIVNGDTLCDVPLAGLVARHRERGALVTLAVIPNPAPDRYNGIVATSDGAVTSFVPKGHARGSWHFVGVQVVDASVFAGLEDGVPAETIAGLYRDLVRRSPGTLQVLPVTSEFFDVGTPRDYLEAALRLGAPDAGGNVIEPPHARIDRTARLERCSIWPGATIAADVRLRECIVAGGVTVPRGFVAAGAVLMPAPAGGVALF